MVKLILERMTEKVLGMRVFHFWGRLIYLTSIGWNFSSVLSSDSFSFDTYLIFVAKQLNNLSTTYDLQDL